jgi:DUF218 domain-containing protein
MRRLLVGACLALTLGTTAGPAAAATLGAAAQLELLLEWFLRPLHSPADEDYALLVAWWSRGNGYLPDASRVLFDTTRYYEVVGRFTGPRRGDFLFEMSLGRPVFIDPHENDATDAQVLAVGPGHGMPYDVLIVPGFTPSNALPTDPIHPAAAERCRMAAGDFLARAAPFVIVTGGNVHPEGTPQNEALLLKAELIDRGVPPDRILVEGYARHSTTNLRNSARFMLDRGFQRALVVTSADQSAYFSFPWFFGFHVRCLRELGYLVGDLQPVDANRTLFTPSLASRTPSYTDPLDW